MSVVVRPAGPDDLAAVLGLLAQLNPEDEALAPDLAVATWRAILAQPGVETLVACLGEAVVAVVSLSSGTNATPEELIAHCKSRVAKWETPKYIEIVDELPQGHTHKLDKREVARRLRDSGRLPWSVS